MARAKVRASAKPKARAARATPSADALYPAIRPFQKARLRVSALHELYYEQSGNPQGKPAVFLHGGPGGGTDPAMRRFFDPQRYRIVLFDQRGCGASRPHAELRENTTWDLVSDIEALRTLLGIDRWLVFGGSWGSTLALAYAQRHPERVTRTGAARHFSAASIRAGMVLSGSTRRRLDLSRPLGAVRGGHSRLRAPRHDAGLLPPPDFAGRGDARRCGARLGDVGGRDQLPAPQSRTTWRNSTIPTMPRPSPASKRITSSIAAFCRADDQLLREVGRIRDIPAVIVQGRYDMVCPMRSAWDLHRAWPEAELRIVPDAGHSAFEAGITRELIAATDRFARRTARR